MTEASAVAALAVICLVGVWRCVVLRACLTALDDRPQPAPPRVVPVHPELAQRAAQARWN